MSDKRIPSGAEFINNARGACEHLEGQAAAAARTLETVKTQASSLTAVFGRDPFVMAALAGTVAGLETAAASSASLARRVRELVNELERRLSGTAGERSGRLH